MKVTEFFFVYLHLPDISCFDDCFCPWASKEKVPEGFANADYVPGVVCDVVTVFDRKEGDTRRLCFSPKFKIPLCVPHHPDLKFTTK